MSMESIKNAALVLIEYQGDWLHDDGRINHLMKDRILFESSIERSKEALAAARAAGMRVVHVGLRFQPGHPELGQAQYGLRAVIPKVGTFPADAPGSDFVEPFTPQEGEFVVQGRTGASGFAGSNLDSYLRNNAVETVYLMGYAAHVCLESTLRDAHDRGYNALVLTDATAAFNAAQQRHFEEDVIHHFGHGVPVAQFENALLTLTR